MNLTLRLILLLVSVVLFVAAVFADTNYGDLLAWGLAAFAAAFLVTEGGLDRSFRGPNRRT